MKHEIRRYNTIIIGSGAAGLNAAVHLYENGQKDIAIVTDLLGGGTSANTGSDKQTYYKLGVSKLPDSPYEMAKDLFNGGAMDGDIALAEAMTSLKEFYHLVELGVNFPYNEYGEYVGYKTDHDLKCRATSAGPLTSQEMYRVLLNRVEQYKIKIFDKYEVIKLLTAGKEKKKRVTGLLALNKIKINGKDSGLALFNCENIILATGGPAGIYKDSVYPGSQTGSTALALEIGAKAKNLTESQYGIASIKFRWNLSGTYQQAIPRYFSTAKDGTDEKEFLNEYFPTMGTLASAIFLKGYQWPFDPRKIEKFGSSLIDLLVYRETKIKGRRVFVDFRQNPKSSAGKTKFKLNMLSKEAYSYLKNSGALLTTPLARLIKMNPAAVELYKNNNIDLAREPLEIAVSAQHNNGGLAGNIWWESNIKHLFPIGEVNGSHGVYRPGGSALNSGQVAGYRTALYIAKRYNKNTGFQSSNVKQLKATLKLLKEKVDTKSGEELETLVNYRNELQERTSEFGAHIRSLDTLANALEDAYKSHAALLNIKVNDKKYLIYLLKTIELSLTHIAYLEAIRYYIQKGGKSRGSYLVMDKNGAVVHKKLEKEWRYKRFTGVFSDRVQETCMSENGIFLNSFRKVRAVPKDEYWFENIWKANKDNDIVK